MYEQSEAAVKKAGHPIAFCQDYDTARQIVALLNAEDEEGALYFFCPHCSRKFNAAVGHKCEQGTIAPVPSRETEEDKPLPHLPSCVDGSKTQFTIAINALLTEARRIRKERGE